MFRMPLMTINVTPPTSVRCKLDLILGNSHLPHSTAMVGNMRDVHRTRVADTVGVRGGSWAPPPMAPGPPRLPSGSMPLDGLSSQLRSINRNTLSSHVTMLPRIKTTGMTGRPSSSTGASKSFIALSPSSLPITTITVTAP
uniref:Uncharacterized protein n=1 Tax=Cacopsylla melanoneura TaxID=428564 RepID=A0A8D9BR46_9HEMI